MLQVVQHINGAAALVRTATMRLGLSARACHRILKIARTIADLDRAAHPGAQQRERGDWVSQPGSAGGGVSMPARPRSRILGGGEALEPQHVSEAIPYRSLDRRGVG